MQQKFDASDTYLANAEKFMDKRAKDILAHKDIGSIVEDSLVHPKAAVSTEEAGSLLKESARLRAVNQSVEADRQLAEALANRRAAVEAKHAPDIEAHRARNESVIKTATQAKTAADNLVNEGFQAIEKQADDAIRVAQVGHNAGDLWRTVAESFVGLRKSIGVRASKMYEDAETASGGLVPPGSNGLARPAQQLIEELPENFESLHPSIVRKLRDIAGTKDPKTGEWIKEPADATWVQLHNLRSQIRQDIKWNDLPSDIRNGTLKFLDGKINEVLHPVETGETAAVGRLPVSAEVKAEPFRPSQVPDPNAPPAYRVAIEDKGKKLFSATLSPWSGEYRINDIERVDPSAKGMGPAAYQKLAEFIRRQHNTELLSGVSGDTSPGAKAVQAKLQAAGLFDAESGAVRPGDRIKEASQLLKLADAFYRENMGPLNNQQIKSLVKALDSGLQADPKALLKATIREGKTEVAETIKKTVGPQTWDAMRAADVQDMMQSSRMTDGSIDAMKFAKAGRGPLSERCAWRAARSGWRGSPATAGQLHPAIAWQDVDQAPAGRHRQRHHSARPCRGGRRREPGQDRPAQGHEQRDAQGGSGGQAGARRRPASPTPSPFSTRAPLAPTRRSTASWATPTSSWLPAAPSRAARSPPSSSCCGRSGPSASSARRWSPASGWRQPPRRSRS